MTIPDVFTFDFTGSRFGSLSDLELSECQGYFNEMERFSNAYLEEAHSSGRWPLDYPWPFDSLHCNTRLWEYPFVLDAVKRYAPANSRLLDIGSALTFFPPFMASAGFQVLATDRDPRMKEWASRLCPMEAKLPLADRLSYAVCDITDPQIEPGTFDIVTNISVIEHLPKDRLMPAVAAIHSLLRDDGLFVCTFDCWIKGERTDEHHPLDQAEFASFLQQLTNGFRPVERHSIRVPADLITNVSFPRSLASRGWKDPTERSSQKNAVSELKRIARCILRSPSNPALEWCAYGIALRKV